MQRSQMNLDYENLLIIIAHRSMTVTDSLRWAHKGMNIP